MHIIQHSFRLLLLSVCLLSLSETQAAQRDAGKDNGAVLKLQGMVKSLTTERDAAKAETTKLTAELEQLKKDHSKATLAAESAKEQLDNELTLQKNTTTEVKDRLEKTNTRLLEVIEKYKQLNQSKADLNNELNQEKAKYQATDEQLNICTSHNIKLLEAGKDLLEHYQNKGTVSALFQEEPILQFNNVEMENIMQEYEDKIKTGTYKKTSP